MTAIRPADVPAHAEAPRRNGSSGGFGCELHGEPAPHRPFRGVEHEADVERYGVHDFDPVREFRVEPQHAGGIAGIGAAVHDRHLGRAGCDRRIAVPGQCRRVAARFCDGNRA